LTAPAVPSMPAGLRRIRALRHACESRDERSGISLAMGIISHVRLEIGPMALEHVYISAFQWNAWPLRSRLKLNVGQAA